MDYEKALAAAKQVRDALKPACEKVVIAGSLRRQKPDVKDIELVCQPKMGGLFGDIPDMGALESAIAAAVNSNLIEWDMQLRRNGEKYKRFRVPALDIAVDLFIAGSPNFGPILAIRTGGAKFSEKLVTKIAFGGLMPDNMRQCDGHLFRDGVRLECPTEALFFEALGLPVLPPQERSLDGIEKLRAALGVGRPVLSARIFTTGYTGKKPEDLLRIATEMGAIVVDIRHSRNSRNPAWTEASLRASLGDRYMICPDYGNRRYAQGPPIEIVDIKAGFRFVSSIKEPIILLCMCPDVQSCHRSDVAVDLRGRGLIVEELTWL